MDSDLDKLSTDKFPGVRQVKEMSAMGQITHVIVHFTVPKVNYTCIQLISGSLWFIKNEEPSGNVTKNRYYYMY